MLTTPFAIEGIGLEDRRQRRDRAQPGARRLDQHPAAGARTSRCIRRRTPAAANGVFSVSGDIERELRLRTVVELRTALAHGQLVLHYQPKADLRTGRVTGVEALVRVGSSDPRAAVPGGLPRAGRGRRADAGPDPHRVGDGPRPGCGVGPMPAEGSRSRSTCPRPASSTPGSHSRSAACSPTATCRPPPSSSRSPKTSCWRTGTGHGSS